MREGLCKLTGKNGPYVKSHIIPAALTQPEAKGAPLVQYGSGHRPLRRWSSWYDSCLVTETGEKILSDYDDWGIAELRRHKLIWSSWDPMMKLTTSDHFSINIPSWGLRKLKITDPARFRLFFLSILWRAAATNLKEFDEVELDQNALCRMGEMVKTGTAEPLEFFPVQLIQISTAGKHHNHSPIADEKIFPGFENIREHRVPFFRFYFDGLIVHFDRRNSTEEKVIGSGPLFVGAEQELAVPTVVFEDSFQRENLDGIVSEAYATWPILMDKILG